VIKEIYLRWLLIVILSNLSLVIFAVAYTQPLSSIRSCGTILDYTLVLKSFPNPSKVNESITISGNLVTSAGVPLSQQRVLIQYSRNSVEWVTISEVTTDNVGDFSLEWLPFSKGLLYIRAIISAKIALTEHVVADYVISADGSGDSAGIQDAINALPADGGVIYTNDGIYDQSTQLRIVNRSNVVLVGSGYNTKIIKTSGLLLRIANVTNLLLRKLHFHHLTNDFYGSIRVDGFNEGLTIDTCWFTRDTGPLVKHSDLVWFNPNGTHRNLQIRNSCFEDAQVDSISLKEVIGGTIENNTFIDAATDTVFNEGSGITVEGCSNLLFRENTIKRTKTQNMVGINVFGSSNNITIAGNTVINTVFGINLDEVSNISVKNNKVTDPKASGIRVENTSNVQIEGNYVEQVEFYRNSTGIFTINNYEITISGNTVANLPSGISVLYARRATISFNSVDPKATFYVSGEHGVTVYVCSNAKINNNTIVRAFENGLAVVSSPKTIIFGNTIARNYRSGIILVNSNNSAITSNTLKNNGQNVESTFERNGVELVDSFTCTVSENRAYDDQPTKTQQYGLVEKGSSDYNTILRNMFRYNQLGAMKIIGTHTIAKDNDI